MRLRINVLTVGLFVMLAQTGCGSEEGTDASPGDDQPSASVTQPTSPPPTATSADSEARQIVGTIVRFSSNTASVDVTIGEDNPAARDFLSMLPLTITSRSSRAGRRSATSRESSGTRGSPGSDPKHGDLIYFVPWGNLGFYYNAEGIGYSDDTIHLGTYDASLDQLERLEGEVTVPEISSGHCRAAITAEVGRLGGVTSVEVDLEEQRVTVVGSVLDDGAIRRAIYDAGYEALSAVEQAPTAGYVRAGSTRKGS